MLSVEQVREMALALPGTSEKLAWGRPCFLVDGKIFASIRDGDAELSVKVSDVDKAALLDSHPEVFSVPAHYARSPMFVVQLAHVQAEQLGSVLDSAWRMTAPAALIEQVNAAD